jgi:hypothetical protein
LFEAADATYQGFNMNSQAHPPEDANSTRLQRTQPVVPPEAGSKPEANWKQTGSKPEANRKQTGSSYNKKMQSTVYISQMGITFY